MSDLIWQVESSICLCIETTVICCFGWTIGRKVSLTQICNEKKEDSADIWKGLQVPQGSLNETLRTAALVHWGRNFRDSNKKTGYTGHCFHSASAHLHSAQKMIRNKTCWSNTECVMALVFPMGLKWVLRTGGICLRWVPLMWMFGKCILILDFYNVN